MAISMLKIRRPLGRLIFNMGIAIPGKTVFLIETAPRLFVPIFIHKMHKNMTTPTSLLTHWGRDKMADISHIFKSNFLTEDMWIALDISLKFIPKGPINNIPALVQIMAWHRPGDKPLS